MRKVMDMLKDISLWNIIKKIYVKKNSWLFNILFIFLIK